MTAPVGGTAFDPRTGLATAVHAAPGVYALFRGFFEPTEEDREEGRKVPGPAHRVVAALVARGAVRVIVTNFDRLIEQALEAVGIMPQVVASSAAVEGMEPLAHALLGSAGIPTIQTIT
jgi:hypothetical protein